MRQRECAWSLFGEKGAFYQHLPPGAVWCEISRGRDFFERQAPASWIVTNPPFSCLTRVFEHAFALADNCVFVIPISKYWSSAPRIALAEAYGGLVEILHLGVGRRIGFDIGFPFGALHFQRGYAGPVIQSRLSALDWKAVCVDEGGGSVHDDSS